jgi:hypothetical protein
MFCFQYFGDFRGKIELFKRKGKNFFLAILGIMPYTESNVVECGGK